MTAYVIAQEKDLLGHELMLFEQQVQACFWSEDSFNQVIIDRGLLLTARVDDGSLAGYLLLQDQTDLYEIMQLSVDARFRRQGIARQLLCLAKQKICIESSSAIFLEVRESNQSAIQLYDGLDFIEVGRRKNYYPAAIDGKREAAILMRYECNSFGL